MESPVHVEHVRHGSQPVTVDEPRLLQATWEPAEGEEGELAVVLRGETPGDWALRLTRALAWRGLALKSGFARRGPDSLLHARLEVVGCRGTEAERRLLAGSVSEPGAPWQLDPHLLEVAFEMVDRPFRALSLEVHAWDCLGLLAGVIERVYAAELEVGAILLETEGECAFHQLLLEARDGGLPGRADRRRLARVLRPLIPR